MPALMFDPLVELDFQRTNLALGKPVDVEKLFDLCQSLFEANADELEGMKDDARVATEEISELKDRIDAAYKATEKVVAGLKKHCGDLDDMGFETPDQFDLADHLSALRATTTVIEGLATNLDGIAEELYH